MKKKRGKQSVFFENPPVISSSACIVGPMEGDGRLKDYYDHIMDDTLQNLSSWEKCESYMMEWCIQKGIEKDGSKAEDIDCIFAGDLLNQLMGANFAVRNCQRPFLGLYGACSTFVEGLIIGSMMVDGGFANKVVSSASSHHETAERQYRFPTELGVQRPPGAQWTVTGAGAAILSVIGSGPVISSATIGKIVDYGIKDPNIMGPAMSPAAVDTIRQHFEDLERSVNDYDAIFTGDLGSIGKEMVIQLMKESNVNLSLKYEDCGCMIYFENQDTHSGASGCASSAVVFCGYLYQMLLRKYYKRILLVGTGSLHSTTSYQQKETIPAIAHAVSIEML